MESWPGQSLWLLILLYAGQYGLCHNPSSTGIPLFESVLQQGVNYANMDSNSPSPQLMNTLLTVANAKGVLPEQLYTSRGIGSQNAQQLPIIQDVNTQTNPNIGAYNSLIPVTSTQTLSVLPTSYPAQPNIIYIPQSHNIQPSIEPSSTLPVQSSNFSPLQTLASQTQSHSSISYDEDSQNYYHLKYEDFFDHPYQQYENSCACPNSDNTPTSTFSAHDVHSTIIDSDINTASSASVTVNENIKQIPYSLEINLPLLTQIVPVADSESLHPSALYPPQVPSTPTIPQYAYPPPPIIIQGSGSKSKKLMPLLLLTLLNNGGGFGNSGGNQCGGCGNTAGIPFPFPMVIPTSNPIIIDELPKRKGKRKSKRNKKEEKKEEKNEESI